MTRVWRNEEPDHLPLLAGGGVVPEQERFSHYTLEEQFSDKEKMLVGHLWGMIGVARGTGDAQPTLRANFGVGFIPSLFGLNSTFTQPDQMPWVMGPLPQERIERVDVPSAEVFTHCLLELGDESFDPQAAEVLALNNLPQRIKLLRSDPALHGLPPCD